MEVGAVVDHRVVLRSMRGGRCMWSGWRSAVVHGSMRCGRGWGGGRGTDS